ncbi:hypothetical protein QYF36_003931 [Acer negundo]|nr:hypothetical protein QYF36_003931 [Acer negundo]
MGNWVSNCIEPEDLREQTLVLQFNRKREGCASEVEKFITKWKASLITAAIYWPNNTASIAVQAPACTWLIFGTDNEYEEEAVIRH